ARLGDARNSPIPQRDRSYWPAPVAIISIAQQARPNVAGHIDCFRAHPTARSSDVNRTPRSTSSSTSSGVFPRCTPSIRSTGTGGRLLPRNRPVARALAHDGALLPIEPALLPDVDVGDEHQRDEHRHLHESEEADRKSDV